MFFLRVHAVKTEPKVSLRSRVSLAVRGLKLLRLRPLEEPASRSASQDRARISGALILLWAGGGEELCSWLLSAIRTCWAAPAEPGRDAMIFPSFLRVAPDASVRSCKHTWKLLMFFFFTPEMLLMAIPEEERHVWIFFSCGWLQA